MDLGSTLFDLCMTPLENGLLEQRRRELISRAGGRVLELGAGTGVNLGYYDPASLTELYLTDPVLRDRLRERAATLEADCVPIHLHELGAEQLPFDDESFDSVVFTLVFCMVPRPLEGLREVRRVLRRDGRIFFIEHVVSEHQGVKRGMELFNRPWHFVSGGCNINRDTESTLLEAGFRFEEFRREAKGLVISGVGRRT